MKLMYGSKELELLQQLKSPFLVGYEDSFPSGFSYCIILEYCEVFRKLTRVNAQSNINLRKDVNKPMPITPNSKNNLKKEL